MNKIKELLENSKSREIEWTEKSAYWHLQELRKEMQQALDLDHVSQRSELVCPAGYYPNSASTGMECVHCGRGKYAH